jgi:uncharacterized protein (TIGR02145 family)
LKTIFRFLKTWKLKYRVLIKAFVENQKFLKMKELICSLAFSVSLFIGYSQSESSDGTTIEEYNYLTKAYSFQIEKGLGMKISYEFAMGNGFNQQFSTEASDGKKYNVELKQLLNNSLKVAERGTLVICNNSTAESKRYFCIPNKFSSSDLWTKYWDDIRSLNNVELLILNWALSKTLANNYNSSSAITKTEEDVEKYINKILHETRKEFKSVKIGSQTWMSENLNIDVFRNGDKIPEVKTLTAWQAASSKKEPAWCYYNFDNNNGIKYGKLYNWYAVNDPRGLAPEGWHIPSDYEWKAIESYLGEDNAAIKMKTSYDWQDTDETGVKGVPGEGNNESGFSALPAGVISDKGFLEKGKSTFFWTSSIKKPSVWFYYWFENFQMYENDDVNENIILYEGNSVRCVKD